MNEYVIHYHTDEKASDWEIGRIAVWCEVPYVRVHLAYSLDMGLNHVRGAVLCAVGLYENPPMQIAFRNEKALKRPKGF